ncbi:MAG: cyclic nucleotide-binding domain-containing protein [Spirochaetales bacterium]|nr:cyclic nucleotide-binding domain-containing protein [Spirochaetales bacterium]
MTRKIMNEISRSKIRRLLDMVIPFRFLPAERKDALSGEWVPKTFLPGEFVFCRGDGSSEVWILEEGQVELTYADSADVKPANFVRSGHYFGERAALLNQDRTHGARAVGECRAWSLSGGRFLGLIGDFSVFAQAFGTILRDKHGVFLPLENFTREVARSLVQGYFRLDRLVEMYRELAPALHPYLDDASRIDIEALTYVVRRLPENVTRSFAWFFTDDIPALYPDPGRLFTAVVSLARRRSVWEMLPGKNMVLIRTGLSDLLDFLTCLCVFSIECRKIRRRLYDPAFMPRLASCRQAEIQGSCDDTDSLAEFPFSAEERAGLAKIWKGQTLARLYEIAVHHEDWELVVERQVNNYNSRRTEKWTNLVSGAVRELTGLDPWDFPENFEVHLVSSNTHSVANCLSPFARDHEAEILAWAEAHGKGGTSRGWNNPEDRLYILAAEWVRADPRRQPSRIQELEWGILRLGDEAAAGIAVQLIDTSKLSNRLDRSLPPAGSKRRLIVNIDYAFGVQAEEIIRNLISIFPNLVASVNILGKAGSLVGQRGDLLVPTAFILQSDDSFHPLAASPSLERLAALAPGSRIFQGPLLTVEGTLLQNRALLHFYRNIWKCVGLEMEGVHYARAVTEACQLGVLSISSPVRYYYYVSDLPLEAGAQLSRPLEAFEGVPPLYAVTREVLFQILSGE